MRRPLLALLVGLIPFVVVPSAHADKTVVIDDLEFDPVQVAPGEQVTWVNNSGRNHQPFGSDSYMGSGGSYSASFTSSTSYTCKIYPSMQGTVTVVSPTTTRRSTTTARATTTTTAPTTTATTAPPAPPTTTTTEASTTTRRTTTTTRPEVIPSTSDEEDPDDDETFFPLVLSALTAIGAVGGAAVAWWRASVARQK